MNVTNSMLGWKQRRFEAFGGPAVAGNVAGKIEFMTLPMECDELVLRVAAKCQVTSEAIEFVLKEIDRCSWLGRHVDGVEFAWRLHDQALLQFSENAKTVINGWGVHSTEDFGRIVFGLVEHGLMTKSENDSFEQFERVFMFEDEFTQLRVKPDPSRRYQFSVGGLLVLTLMAAFTLAGVMRFGLNGAFFGLFSGWLLIAGLACIICGVLEKNRTGLILMAMGAVLFGSGFLALFI